jgi:multidrug resistance efflux pump
VTRIRRTEDVTFDRRKRGIWSKRLRRLGLLAVLTLGIGAVTGVLSRGIVLDGLVVHRNVVEPRAPAAARVTELLVEPGATVRRGDVLLRLEGLETASRRPFEEEVAEHETRLALAHAGGELDGGDVGRRLDFVEQALLHAELSRADHDVALARLGALEEEREGLAAAHEEERVARAGTTDSLREELSRVTASRERATAESRRAGYDAQRAAALEEDGFASERDSLAAAVESEKALGGVDEAAALVRSRERQLELSTDLSELEARSAEEEMDAMLARIEVAQREVRTNLVRAGLWEGLAEERRSMLPGDDVDGARLRELELELLEARVRRARARLEEHDREIGNRVVRAECDGVVDRVFVRHGSVVDAEAPLLSYYDPDEVQLVVYGAPGAQAEGLRAGAECRVFPVGHGQAVDARIASVALSWVPRPGLLERDDPSTREPHLPATVELLDGADGAFLSPNRRLRVVLRSGWLWE